MERFCRGGTASCTTRLRGDTAEGRSIPGGCSIERPVDRFRQHVHEAPGGGNGPAACACLGSGALHGDHRCDGRNGPRPCGSGATPGISSRIRRPARLQQRGRRTSHGGGRARTRAHPRGGAPGGARRRRKARGQLRPAPHARRRECHRGLHARYPVACGRDRRRQQRGDRGQRARSCRITSRLSRARGGQPCGVRRRCATSHRIRQGLHRDGKCHGRLRGAQHRAGPRGDT